MKTPELSGFENKWKSAMEHHATGRCLEGSDLIELASRGKRARNYDDLMDHISACSLCSDTLKGMLSVPRRRQISPSWLLLPAAATIAIAYLMATRTPPIDTVVETPRKATRSQPPILVQQDPVTKKTFPVAVAPKANPIKWRLEGIVAMNDGTFVENGLLLPSYAASEVKELRTSPSVSRGGSSGASQIQLNEPEVSNRALLEVPKKISWSSVPNTSGYDIKVEVDGEPAEVHVSGNTAEIVSADKAAKLTIRITPILNPESATIEQSAEESVFAFEILTPEKKLQVRWAEKNARKAPLAAALVLFRLGRFDEAVRSMPETSNKQVLSWAKALRRARDLRMQDPGEL